jgi:hypothetical protein
MMPSTVIVVGNVFVSPANEAPTANTRSRTATRTAFIAISSFGYGIDTLTPGRLPGKAV